VTNSEVMSALQLATSDGMNHTCSDHHHPAALCKICALQRHRYCWKWWKEAITATLFLQL